MFNQEHNIPFLSIECQFFKLIFESLDQLSDLSSFESAEKGALTTFLVAFKQVASDTKGFSEKYSFKIKLEYDFPYGIGLGSSASFNIALAAAVTTCGRKVLAGSVKNLSDVTFEDQEELWNIKQLADEGEKVAHKSVSGTNTAVIALGVLIKYCMHSFRGVLIIIYSKILQRHKKT